MSNNNNPIGQPHAAPVFEDLPHIVVEVLRTFEGAQCKGFPTFKAWLETQIKWDVESQSLQPLTPQGAEMLRTFNPWS